MQPRYQPPRGAREQHQDQHHGQAGQQSSVSPALSAVQSYVSQFYNAMKNNRVPEVRTLYNKQWNDLTSTFFQESEWPAKREVAPFCEENEVFLLCYGELCFRHIFVHGSPYLNHRFESWSNYRSLFDVFLDGATTDSLVLPLEWLNDMIDEFVYQFQDFHQYRLEMSSKSEEEKQILAQNPNVWKVGTVLGYLTSFVERSGITKGERSFGDFDGTTLSMGNAGAIPVLKALGYFCVIGLCRVQTLLADYRFAVKVLDPINIDDRRALFTQVTACHVTLFYSLGFSYLMMHRYADALEIFSQILLAHRASRERSVSFADEQMNKYEKISALAAMAIALSPGVRVDEQVRRLITDKSEKLVPRVTEGDGETVVDLTRGFEELFHFACPKFITPSPPDYTQDVDRHREAYQSQLARFMSEVNLQLSLPTIRSYLKLYKSIPIPKLAKFCGMEAKTFREHLISIKGRSTQLVRSKDGSPPLEGKPVVVSDVHFYLVGDMVHVEEAQQVKSFGRYLVNQTLRFENIVDDLSKKVELQMHPMHASEAD